MEMAIVFAASMLFLALLFYVAVGFEAACSRVKVIPAPAPEALPTLTPYVPIDADYVVELKSGQKREFVAAYATEVGRFFQFVNADRAIVASIAPTEIVMIRKYQRPVVTSPRAPRSTISTGGE